MVRGGDLREMVNTFGNQQGWLCFGAEDPAIYRCVGELGRPAPPSHQAQTQRCGPDSLGSKGQNSVSLLTSPRKGVGKMVDDERLNLMWCWKPMRNQKWSSRW